MEKTTIFTDNESIIQKLMRIPALQSFERQDLENLLRLSEIRTYGAGEKVLSEGKQDGWVYYLVSGKLKISKKGKTLMILQRSGDVFGEMSALGVAASSASVETLEETVCLAVDISDIDRVSVKDKFAFRYIIYKEFAEALATRLKITSEELIRTKEKLERLEVAYQLAIKTAELAEAQNELAKLKKQDNAER